MFRFSRRVEVLLVCCGVLAACAPPESNPAATEAVDRKLLTGTGLYPSPDEAPIDDAWVYLEDGRIKTVGTTSSPPPAGATPMGVHRWSDTAGFQNSHVHFTHDSFAEVAARPAEDLSAAFERMLTGFGFTTVADTGVKCTIRGGREIFKKS